MPDVVVAPFTQLCSVGCSAEQHNFYKNGLKADNKPTPILPPIQVCMVRVCGSEWPRGLYGRQL